ncbi:DNA polymerase IV [Curtobacterium sp. RRHDQ10]|uniref:DNA polymerase IV n=1 Tax=Curtobacterium phyllosphaerae TaxID=3413379 RepID=UPI003BF22574
MSKQDGSTRLVTDAPVDDRTATVLHVDMDAFFASVELLDRPDLVGRPVIVGHDSDRSVVTAATYEARKYGINSAMPMAIARRRCPHAVIVEPHFEKYTAKSRAVMEVFDRFTPVVERLGIDEAFLDVAGALRMHGTPWNVGRLIRQTVLAETGLHCSVGAAATKFVAKLASSRAKPDGLLVVPAADTVAFLHPQPVSGLWGVGGKTQETLERRGIRTIGDLAHTPVESLVSALGPAGGAKLFELAWGRDPRSVETGSSEKSVGHEVTFAVDVTDRDELARELLRLAEKVAVRMRAARVQARTIAIKVRYTDFTTLTRSRTLAEPTDVARRIHKESVELYDVLHRPGNRIRLVGVRGENLVPAGGSNALWDDDAPWRETETTVDAVVARFGAGVLRPASLVRGRAGHDARGTPAPGSDPDAPRVPHARQDGGS